jgi:hypothetical protein
MSAYVGECKAGQCKIAITDGREKLIIFAVSASPQSLIGDAASIEGVITSLER